MPDVDPNLMRAVARSRPRMNDTAPSTEQVNLVVDLGELARVIVEHNSQVMAGEPANWAALTDLLDTAADACRRQVVIELDDMETGSDQRGRQTPSR